MHDCPRNVPSFMLYTPDLAPLENVLTSDLAARWLRLNSQLAGKLQKTLIWIMNLSIYKWLISGNAWTCTFSYRQFPFFYAIRAAYLPKEYIGFIPPEKNHKVLVRGPFLYTMWCFLRTLATLFVKSAPTLTFRWRRIDTWWELPFPRYSRYSDW